MKAKYIEETDTIELCKKDEIGGIELLESLYDEKLRKPVFITLIKKMSTNLGVYKKDENGIYVKSSEACKNLDLMATINIE